MSCENYAHCTKTYDKVEKYKTTGTENIEALKFPYSILLATLEKETNNQRIHSSPTCHQPNANRRFAVCCLSGVATWANRYGTTLHLNPTQSSTMYTLAILRWTNSESNNSKTLRRNTTEMGNWTFSKWTECFCPAGFKTQRILKVLHLLPSAQGNHNSEYRPHLKYGWSWIHMALHVGRKLGIWVRSNRKKNQDKTTFTTLTLQSGTYKFLRMLLGLSSKPTNFWRTPDILLSGFSCRI